MRFAVLVLLAAVSAAPATDGADPEKILARIKAVAKEGAGNQEVGAAWKELVAVGGPALFPTLTALNDATPLAANWLRPAANAIAEQERTAGRTLPADRLEAFFKDLKNAPASRRIAYELLVQMDPKSPDRLLPGHESDPSVEMRRDAIAAALTKAEKLAGEAAKTEYARLFEASRDEEQAEKLAEALKKLGGQADLLTHFNVVVKWMLAGPFDSPKGVGFAKSFEPEAKVDEAATYKGKVDARVKLVLHTAAAVFKLAMPEDAVRLMVTWVPHTTPVKDGEVNLNEAIGKYKDAVAYAFTVLESDKEQAVEFRFGCINAIKVFLNGKEVFAREEYHHGERFDQYIVPVTLKAGKNEVLLKVTQNDQKEPYAQVWQFKFRVSDVTGGAVPVKAVLK